MNTKDILQTLKVEEGRVTVSSLDVAMFFDKRHDNVMQAISNLLELKPELGHLNFKESLYTNSQNKSQPCYLMDRKGFTLLAMGFTGERALEFKDAFYDAFEEMELRLKSSSVQPNLPSREKGIIEGALLLMDAFSIPKHLGFVETVKEVKRLTGTDYDGLVPLSPVMDNIKKEEEMLEPTELGKLYRSQLASLGYVHGNTGINANNYLAAAGYQRKENGFWRPTDKAVEGRDFTRHAWKKGNKSNYNYKWGVRFFGRLFG